MEFKEKVEQGNGIYKEFVNSKWGYQVHQSMEIHGIDEEMIGRIFTLATMLFAQAETNKEGEQE